MEWATLSSKARWCPILFPHLWPRDKPHHVTEREPGPEKGHNVPKVTQPDTDNKLKLLSPAQA